MFSGSLSATMYIANNIFLIGSFITMQYFVEWENYQLKKSQTWKKQNSTSLQKPGIIAILVISLASSHLYVTFFISDDLKTQDYHMCKVF